MAVVVEQTIPFSPKILDLENASRWNQLFPLIRPTLKAVQTPQGLTILVDTEIAARNNGKFVHVVVVSRPGHLSSKLLDERGIVTAIVTDHRGGEVLSAEDVAHAMTTAGASVDHGLVILRLGSRGDVTQRSDFIEVEVETPFQLDHALMVLHRSTESCRVSAAQTLELLRQFVATVSSSSAKFLTGKDDSGQPAILCTNGPKGYHIAADVVGAQLLQAMKSHHHKDNTSTVCSVHVSDVNGLGRLENYLIIGDIGKRLDAQNVRYSLSHSTTLDHDDLARGFHISIASIPAHLIIAQPAPKPHQSAQQNPATAAGTNVFLTNAKMVFDDASVRKRIENGCNAVIREEPTITEYDTIVGDGDCGYTLRDGAKQVLSFIADKDLTALPQTVAALVHDLEVNMGGTSGALYCIFLTALAGCLAAESSIAQALQTALVQLMKYTRARLGDRTMMDALIPFVETLARTGNADQALADSKAGVESTKTMEAKLGRSTYLDESATQGVPDPGAYGLWVLLSGMVATAT